MSDSSVILRQQQSRLLQCFRAIGMITDDVPLVWYGMGKESFATVSLGKSFVVYKCDKLTPVLVSPQTAKRIAALAVLPKHHLTFTACGRQILVWKRVKHVETLVGHPGAIQQLLMAGTVLLSLDDAQTIKIWDTETMTLVDTLTFPQGFSPSVMLHPSTYLNKILVGSHEGALALWNIRTMSCIYEFKGWGSAITSLEQSPAVDVVGIGLGNGKLVMHHLQLDKQVLSFHQEQSRVTAISFRTDGAAPAPYVVSGMATGDIAIWNLENKRLESMLTNAHDGPIVSLVFLPNEPLLLSTGSDNSIKMWIFDHLTGGTARLLKSREGHKAPPTRIRYYGNNTFTSMADGADGTCCQILSAGQDRAFRVFHTAREQQSTELSQGPMLKKAKKLHLRIEDVKLPPITQFAAMETRERDWANVVTCHENEIAAYVWRFEHRAIGKKILRQFDPSIRVAPGSAEDQQRQKGKATSVAMSTCGNFALVGSIGGVIYKYNMQSGEKRGSYPTAATPKAALIRSLTLPGASTSTNVEPDTSMAHAHDGPISGVVVDAVNQHVVSGSIDGQLKFWDFRSHSLVFQVDVGSPICQMELHRDSNLLAVASDDQVVRLYDITTRKLVRRFHGHTHRLTDLIFSNDARWLFTSSADASLRVWDIPTGKCIDWIKFQKPVTGVAISPTGEFVATTHVGHVGIFLWANRAFFMDVLLDAEPTDPVLIDLPVPLNEVENEDQLGHGSEGNPLLSVDSDRQETDAMKEEVVETTQDEVEPLEPSLITLSTAPRAMWHSLFHLELIKKRNKPLEPPKAPEQAPFFLPTTRKDDVHPSFMAIESKPSTSQATAGDDGQAVVKEEEHVEMDGWGVDEDDATWGEDTEDPVADEQEAAASQPGSRIMKSTGMVSTRCKLATLLSTCVHQTTVQQQTTTGQPHMSRFHDVARYLQSLSASGVDVELSTLCMGEFDEEGKHLLELFLVFVEEEMGTRRDFQVLQAYLNRFVKLHEQLLVQDGQLLTQVDRVCTLQQAQWEHLQKLLHNNLCLVQYFSNIQM